MKLASSHAFLLLVSATQVHSRGLSFRQANQNASSACSLLKEYQADSTLVAADGGPYTQQREAHWSQTAWKNPGCIYMPKSTDDVVRAVGILTSTQTKFAVRGGGHSPLTTWANIDDGVLISMQGIADKTYDAASQTVKVGFGSTWIQVYEYLEQYSRLAVGGRAPTVGMGYLTGGGMSHLSNAYGFGSDNVVAYELVLANATAITVTPHSHADLFYALKAGGNNYGIVTHVTLRTYPLGKVWGGTLVYTNDYRDQLMQAFATYQSSGQLDTKSALLAYLGINNNTAYVTLMYLDAVERPAAFKPFYDIPSVFDSTRIRDNFSAVISEEVDRVVPRWTFGATTFFLDNETYVEVGKISQEASKKMAAINGGTMVLMPQPISMSMIKASQARGRNPMNLTCREQMWFCINIGWNLEADDKAVGEILMDTINQIDVLTKQKGLYDKFVFLNDAYYSQEVFASYGAGVFQALQSAASKYDPNLVFQKLVPGGFKLQSAVQ